MLTPESQINALLKKGRFNGSWLIVGPFGVGKRDFAKRLSSFLLTGDWQQDVSTHPDIKWIERGFTEEVKKDIQKTILAGKSVDQDALKSAAHKSEITVEDVRVGLKFLSLKPSGSSKRVLVIELADDLNQNAANALLKALEEPAQNVVILLLCENLGKLLPTIRSRCRKITIRPLSTKELIQKIKVLIPDCPDPDFLAEIARGSLGMARLIDTENGILIYQKLQSFQKPFSELDIEKVNQFADGLVKNESHYHLFKYFLLNMLADILTEKALKQDSSYEFWDSFYQETNTLFNQTENLYLDKKQSIINILIQMAQGLENA